jgi:hypothetical protein
MEDGVVLKYVRIVCDIRYVALSLDMLKDEDFPT